MIEVEKIHRCGVDFWHVPSWSKEGLFHGFAGRSLDLSASVQAWDESFGRLGLKLFLLEQVHGAEIVRFNPRDIDCWSDTARGGGCRFGVGDAWVVDFGLTDNSELVFGIKTADCYPVIVRSKKSRLVAALHCGWRGAVKESLLIKVLRLFRDLGEQPSDLELAIGPGAGGCCYEIGEDVANQVLEALGKFWGGIGGKESIAAGIIRSEAGKILCDIGEFLVMQAIASGVPAEQIARVKICTICNEQFFSYRREKSYAGRQVSFIGARALSN